MRLSRQTQAYDFEAVHIVLGPKNGGDFCGGEQYRRCQLFERFIDALVIECEVRIGAISKAEAVVANPFVQSQRYLLRLPMDLRGTGR